MYTTPQPRVPEGLRELMKDFTKAILEEKPDNIYEFSEQYFQQKLNVKNQYEVKNFEPIKSHYKISNIVQENQLPHRIVPISIVHSIVPTLIKELIKGFIKAVIKQRPQNLCEFAAAYFNQLRATYCVQHNISYEAYENYMKREKQLSGISYIKCTCGRLLINSFDRELSKKENATHDAISIDNNITTTSENSIQTYSKHHIKAICTIQRYVRKYLKCKADKKRDGHVSIEQAVLIIQKWFRNVLKKRRHLTATDMEIVPSLTLKKHDEDRNENNLELETSYTSASTAIHSAESGIEPFKHGMRNHMTDYDHIIENNLLHFPKEEEKIAAIDTENLQISDTTEIQDMMPLNENVDSTNEMQGNEQSRDESNLSDLSQKIKDVIIEEKKEKKVNETEEIRDANAQFQNRTEDTSNDNRADVHKGHGEIDVPRKHVDMATKETAEISEAKEATDINLRTLNEGEVSSNEIQANLDGHHQIKDNAHLTQDVEDMSKIRGKEIEPNGAEETIKKNDIKPQLVNDESLIEYSDSFNKMPTNTIRDNKSHLEGKSHVSKADLLLETGELVDKKINTLSIAEENVNIIEMEDSLEKYAINSQLVNKETLDNKVAFSDELKATNNENKKANVSESHLPQEIVTIAEEEWKKVHSQLVHDKTLDNKLSTSDQVKASTNENNKTDANVSYLPQEVTILQKIPTNTEKEKQVLGEAEKSPQMKDGDSQFINSEGLHEKVPVSCEIQSNLSENVKISYNSDDLSQKEVSTVSEVQMEGNEPDHPLVRDEKIISVNDIEKEDQKVRDKLSHLPQRSIADTKSKTDLTEMEEAIKLNKADSPLVSGGLTEDKVIALCEIQGIKGNNIKMEKNTGPQEGTSDNVQFDVQKSKNGDITVPFEKDTELDRTPDTIEANSVNLQLVNFETLDDKLNDSLEEKTNIDGIHKTEEKLSLVPQEIIALTEEDEAQIYVTENGKMEMKIEDLQLQDEKALNDKVDSSNQTQSNVNKNTDIKNELSQEKLPVFTKQITESDFESTNGEIVKDKIAGSNGIHEPNYADHKFPILSNLKQKSFEIINEEKTDIKKPEETTEVADTDCEPANGQSINERRNEENDSSFNINENQEIKNAPPQKETSLLVQNNTQISETQPRLENDGVVIEKKTFLNGMQSQKVNNQKVENDLPKLLQENFSEITKDKEEIMDLNKVNSQFVSGDDNKINFSNEKEIKIEEDAATTEIAEMEHKSLNDQTKDGKVISSNEGMRSNNNENLIIRNLPPETNAAQKPQISEADSRLDSDELIKDKSHSSNEVQTKKSEEVHEVVNDLENSLQESIRVVARAKTEIGQVEEMTDNILKNTEFEGFKSLNGNGFMNTKESAKISQTSFSLETDSINKEKSNIDKTIRHINNEGNVEFPKADSDIYPGADINKLETPLEKKQTDKSLKEDTSEICNSEKANSKSQKLIVKSDSTSDIKTRVDGNQNLDNEPVSIKQELKKETENDLMENDDKNILTEIVKQQISQEDKMLAENTKLTNTENVVQNKGDAIYQEEFTTDKPIENSRFAEENLISFADLTPSTTLLCDNVKETHQPSSQEKSDEKEMIHFIETEKRNYRAANHSEQDVETSSSSSLNPEEYLELNIDNFGEKIVHESINEDIIDKAVAESSFGEITYINIDDTGNGSNDKEQTLNERKNAQDIYTTKLQVPDEMKDTSDYPSSSKNANKDANTIKKNGAKSTNDRILKSSIDQAINSSKINNPNQILDTSNIDGKNSVQSENLTPTIKESTIKTVPINATEMQEKIIDGAISNEKLHLKIPIQEHLDELMPLRINDDNLNVPAPDHVIQSKKQTIEAIHQQSQYSTKIETAINEIINFIKPEHCKKLDDSTEIKNNSTQNEIKSKENAKNGKVESSDIFATKETNYITKSLEGNDNESNTREDTDEKIATPLETKENGSGSMENFALKSSSTTNDQSSNEIMEHYEIVSNGHKDHQNKKSKASDIDFHCDTSDGDKILENSKVIDNNKTIENLSQIHKEIDNINIKENVITKEISEMNVEKITDPIEMEKDEINDRLKIRENQLTDMDSKTDVSQELIIAKANHQKIHQIESQQPSNNISDEFQEMPITKESVNLNEKLNPTDDQLRKQTQMISNYQNSNDFKRKICDFLNSERLYSCAVNRKGTFSKYDLENINKTMTSFMDSITDFSNTIAEMEEPPCIKKTLNINLIKNVNDDDDDHRENFTKILSEDDSFGKATEKMQKTENVIEKIKQRQGSTIKIPSNGMAKTKEVSFDEPPIKSINTSPDTDDENIIIENMKFEKSTESSGNSDDVIYGNNPGMNNLKKASTDLAKNTTTKLEELHENEICEMNKNCKIHRPLIKSVTIDESVHYIERVSSNDSFILDNDTSANIRRKIMAYSVSENDSDFIEKAESEDDRTDDKYLLNYDNFNIKTVLTDNVNTSTETESTIVSAATKIQANARGFLIRKRMNRTSLTSGTKSSIKDDSKTSIGTGTFSESIEHLVQEAAAKLIQNAYRKHYTERKLNISIKNEEISAELSAKRSLLAQRRLTLQRGDALRNDSTPDEVTSGNSTNSSNGNEKKTPTTIKCSNTGNTVNDNKNIYGINWFSIRQNSMPVQIDSEVFRVIPKRLRKRIQSAEINDKKTTPRSTNKSSKKEQ